MSLAEIEQHALLDLSNQERAILIRHLLDKQEDEMDLMIAEEDLKERAPGTSWEEVKKRIDAKFNNNSPSS